MNDELQPIPLALGERPPVPGAVKISTVELPKISRTQTKARKAALDVLYEAEQRGLEPVDVLAERRGLEKVREFTFEIIHGIAENRSAIDQRISECARDWTLERLASVDRNLARIAIWELDYSETPAQAAISEALELADLLSTDESVAFLNGLLGRAAEKKMVD